METVRSVFNFLLICLEVVLIFNLLIVVHELGHFLAGRWRGLVIEKFGIWFGKPIWKKTVNGVQYSLGSIPVGGFVALPQMAPMDMIEGETDTPRSKLPPVSALDKIIVAAAGPLFSLGLALVFAVIVWAVGRPVSEAEATKTIGYVVPDSPAAKAGLQAGDEILEVDGNKVERFGGMSKSVTWYVVRSEGKTIPFKVRRGDQTLMFYPEPKHTETTSWFKRQSLRQVLIEPKVTPTVADVQPGSAAAKAGLQKDDEIEKINGETMMRAGGLIDYEENHPGQPMELTVRRPAKGKNRAEQTVTLRLEVPAPSPVIAAVVKDGPAAQAGIREGDLVLAFNGEKMQRYADVTTRIKATAGKPFTLTIQRHDAKTGKDETFERTLSARAPEKGGDPLIGVSLSAQTTDGLAWYEGGPQTLAHPGPLEQVASSVQTVVNTVGAILSPKSDVKLQHLSGPVMIFRTYYTLFDSEYGWRMALWFSVILNVNLALLNLLPIPVLDGGHILLALIESVRRRPVSLRVLEVVQTACFLMIAGYMLYVTFYDVVDSPFGRRKPTDDLKFSKQSQSQQQPQQSQPQTGAQPQAVESAPDATGSNAAPTASAQP